MSEERPRYGLLYSDIKHDTVEQACSCQDKPEHSERNALRVELEEIERRLIPLLVIVQRALGKEPSVTTRAERRAR